MDHREVEDAEVRTLEYIQMEAKKLPVTELTCFYSGLIEELKMRLNAANCYNYR